MTLDVDCAAVLTPVAPLFAEARVASAQISQLVAGKVVELLERRDDWFRIRGPDEYEGWLHRGYLALGSEFLHFVQLAFEGSNGLFKIEEHGPRRELREEGKLKIRLRTGQYQENLPSHATEYRCKSG